MGRGNMMVGVVGYVANRHVVVTLSQSLLVHTVGGWPSEKDQTKQRVIGVTFIGAREGFHDARWHNTFIHAGNASQMTMPTVRCGR